jgi:ADP-ribose pyrophosphatase YjhB (NUDIX family)
VSIVRGGRERSHCPACDRTWFRNPTAGVAVILLDGDRILLGRRASGPYRGFWCIPCGHVEWDEEVRAAARREFIEETGLEVELIGVYTVHSNFHDAQQHTVGIWFLGRASGGALRAGDDLDRVEFVPLHGPLPDLAFPTDRVVIEQLRADVECGRLPGSLAASLQ